MVILYKFVVSCLEIFRVHPNGCRIEKAEKTLKAQANKSALTYCQPYGFANSFGWWVYPGMNSKITCYDSMSENRYVGRWGGIFEYEIEKYDSSDYETMEEFEKVVPSKDGNKYAGKAHFAIDEPEKNCASLWTGFFARMPRDWALMIKSPTNIGLIYDSGSPACVQEGILEVDWMQYDMWINFKFHTYGVPLIFNRDQELPIAQLIPIHRSCYETNWDTIDKVMNSSDPECVEVYERYAHYNYQKWIATGQKDPFTLRKNWKKERGNRQN
jgi:hypothetical protein